MGRDARQKTGPSTIRATEAEYWRFRTLAGDAQMAEAAANAASEVARAKAKIVKDNLDDLAKKYHVTPTARVNFDDEKFTIECLSDGPTGIASRLAGAAAGAGKSDPPAGAAAGAGAPGA